MNQGPNYQPPITMAGNQQPKGNLQKLDYDPFSDLGNPSSYPVGNNERNDLSNNMNSWATGTPVNMNSMPAQHNIAIGIPANQNNQQTSAKPNLFAGTTVKTQIPASQPVGNSNNGQLNWGQPVTNNTMHLNFLHCDFK